MEGIAVMPQKIPQTRVNECFRLQYIQQASQMAVIAVWDCTQTFHLDMGVTTDKWRSIIVLMQYRLFCKFMGKRNAEVATKAQCRQKQQEK